MKRVDIQTRAAWREWLAANHSSESGVWLVYHKKHAGVESVEYGASVEEALCYGWVDSLIKRLDDERYARKFTPRRETSRWSLSNRKRVEKMIKQGLMTECGLAMVRAAKHRGTWEGPDARPTLAFAMTAEFADALKRNRKAGEAFQGLARGYQAQFLGWIELAKRPETKQKRIQESVRLLEQGRRLGLK